MGNRRLWLTFLAGGLAILLLALWSLANISDAAQVLQRSNPAATVAPDMRGTEQQPLVIASASPPDERGTTQLPLVLDPSSLKTSADLAEDKADRAERKDADFWAKVIGVVTISILALQGIAFWIQIGKLTESIAEMKHATQATRDAADAERATVEMMDRTARRQLTAYLFLGSIDLKAFNPGRPLQVAIVFKNFGQTPAYQISIAGGVHWGPTFDPAAAVGTPISTQLPHIGPSQAAPVYISGEGEVTGQMQDELMAGTKVLTVWATVKYVDTFGTNRFLRIRFRSGDGKGFAQTQLVPCDEGNEADFT